MVGLSSSAGPIGSPLLAFALLQLQLKFADAPFEFVDAPYLLVDHQVAHVYLFIFSGVEHNGAGFGLHTVRAAVSEALSVGESATPEFEGEKAPASGGGI